MLAIVCGVCYGDGVVDRESPMTESLILGVGRLPGPQHGFSVAPLQAIGDGLAARRDDAVMARVGEVLEAYPLEGAEQHGDSALSAQGASAEPGAGTRMAQEEVVLPSPPAPSAPLTIFGSNDAVEIINRASHVATALKEVIVKQHLYATISGKNYVTVEGWELAGTLLGVFPRLEWTRRIRGSESADYQRDGWEARVAAVHIGSDNVLGVAEQMCVRDEPTWKGREDFALRGMAQTRATSRALRIPLGFVMKLAGFEATSAEEMRK